MTYAEALEGVLCWGWIDGLRKGFDERSFLQRYTPRNARSSWSQINCDPIARLAAAKADGRWNAAHAPMRLASADTVPADLRAAIDANAKAKKTFASLDRVNLFALTLVGILARGEVIVPRAPKRKPAGRAAPRQRSSVVNRNQVGW